METSRSWATGSTTRPKEDGFTLVEALVASALLALIFVGTFSVISTALDSLQRTRKYQQATLLGNESVEFARDLKFEELVMNLTDPTVTGDATISFSGPDPTYDADGAGPVPTEPIVASTAGGSVDPHVVIRAINGIEYRVSRYVSWVDDPAAPGVEDYKRYLVRVEWPDGDRRASYQTSTFLTDARRGLPLPEFEVTPRASAQAATAGSEIFYTFSIRNLGIVDAYDITVELPTGIPGWNPVVVYLDDDATYSPGFEIPVIDTNGNAIPDTGNVPTDERVFVHVVWEIPVNDKGGIGVVGLTATSGADSSVSDTVKAITNVGPAGRLLWLHNDPTPPIGDTSAQTILLMNETAGTGSALFNYSANYDLVPGRFLQTNTTGPATAKQITWVYQLPTASQVSGLAGLSLWMATEGLRCSAFLNVSVKLNVKKNASGGASAFLAQGNTVTAPVVATDPCSFQEVLVPLTVPDTAIPELYWVEIVVTVSNLAGGANALVAYDTVIYPSYFILPTLTS